MTDLLPITRQALVCLPPPAGDGARRVLDRWLGEWQVDHAADMGCSGLFILGGGGGPEAVGTRLAAERQGLKVREIATPHALAGAIAPGELLLVLQPQVLPSASDWWRQATHQGLVLTFPAAAGVEAGFERIDLSRAWAGAMLIPGHAVHRLLELPEDVEAAPALLRVALQAGVPELRLPDEVLASGAWPVLGRGVPVRLHEEKWLAQRLEATISPGDTLTGRMCRAALRRWGTALPGKQAAVPITLALAGLLAAGGVAASFYGAGAAGLGLVAVAALALELGSAIAALQRGRERLNRHLPKLRWVIDLALLATGYLNVEGRWFRQAFPAIVLVLALNLPRERAVKGSWWRAALADRALIAAVVAVLALAASPEVGMMLGGVTLLIGAVASRPRS
ncbi:MAG: hypothetical protein ABIT10_07900 [Alteraurantiacibacter sp.]